MPELPEVETVRRGLQPVMEGRRIVSADVRRDGLRWPFPDRMAQRLAGVRVLRLRRRSKYILGDLDSGETLLIHLGMSGRVLISGAVVGQFHREHAAPGRHDHVAIDMEDGARITFNDARRFGAMDLLETARAEQHPLLSRLGPEPLGNGFDETYLAEVLRAKRTSVKAALLDQRIVAGLGNIYACEILFRAGIAPTRRTDRISTTRIAGIVGHTRDVLREAIDSGGSSLRDHRQVDGDLGYFQHAFRVYGREGEPCVREGCGATIRRIVQSGRSTFHCPNCQR